MNQPNGLSRLGWQPFFQQQISLEEWEQYQIARITTVERSMISLLTTEGALSIPTFPGMPEMTVGDWLLLKENGGFHRLLDRTSLFSRKAAGTKVAAQLIAANVDTVFVVSSLNQDFNLNRMERYLALASEVGVEAVIVLSKADCCSDPQTFVDQVQQDNPFLQVFTVNGLNADSVSQLEPWCGSGKTVAFIGSSGVGKSTLINTLAGEYVEQTSSIREDDSKGRHTTSRRTLHQLPTGGLLIDTPGMRELQLVDCEHGIEDTFAEIIELAEKCKFSDCHHESEPGCAVQKAIESGEIDQRRLNNFRKLMREQAMNSESLAEKRARDKAFGKHVNAVVSAKDKHKRG